MEESSARDDCTRICGKKNLKIAAENGVKKADTRNELLNCARRESAETKDADREGQKSTEREESADSRENSRKKKENRASSKFPITKEVT